MDLLEYLARSSGLRGVAYPHALPLLGDLAARLLKLTPRIYESVLRRLGPLTPLEVGLGVSTGVPGLDAMLGGGLRPGFLYHVSGGPGVGKTQFLMQAAAYAASGGLSVVYIDTEGDFRPERVATIAAERGLGEDVLDRILVARPQDPVSLESYVAAAAGLGNSMVIVDTITAPVRGLWGLADARRLFRRVLFRLHETALGGRVVVFSTQVTSPLGELAPRFIPAGGRLPLYLSTHVIWIRRLEGGMRGIRLAKSPLVPSTTEVVVNITEAGVEE